MSPKITLDRAIVIKINEANVIKCLKKNTSLNKMKKSEQKKYENFASNSEIIKSKLEKSNNAFRIR